MVWIIWQLVWTSTWQLGWKVGSTVRCRVVLPEVRHWELVESYRLQTLCECRERRRGYPAVVNSRKDCCPGEDAGWYGRRRAYLSWQESFEKLQKKLNARRKRQSTSRPKQNWINRESKRLEAESARLTELQESLRVRKETLKVAYEEIKILREDLLREGETMDKNKSHFLSLENTEEIRRLEQQELAFWRGSASKRLAGWTRDGSTEEIAGWMMEAQRLNKEVEAKRIKLKRRSRGSQRKMPGGIHEYCKQYSSVNNMRKRKNSGLSNAVTDPMSLKVLSWWLDWQKTVQIFFCHRFQCSQIGTCCCCKNVSENWIE